MIAVLYIDDAQRGNGEYGHLAVQYGTTVVTGSSYMLLLFSINCATSRNRSNVRQLLFTNLKGKVCVYLPFNETTRISSIMASNSSTGYGPRQLMFDGDESRYELWEVRFLGYMRKQKLLEAILPGAEPAAGKKAEAFAELVLFLDDRSLSLIIRDAKDDGREALKILRAHYQGKSKPRIISLYTELTSLKKGHRGVYHRLHD